MITYMYITTVGTFIYRRDDVYLTYIYDAQFWLHFLSADGINDPNDKLLQIE